MAVNQFDLFCNLTPILRYCSKLVGRINFNKILGVKGSKAMAHVSQFSKLCKRTTRVLRASPWLQ